MARKIWISKDGKLTAASESPFGDEDQLQRMFNDNPEVVPCDDLELSQLMVIGRESTLPSGSIDLLAVTRSGEIVVIEFKNAGNAQGRREIIAQLIDYGASLWKTFATFKDLDERIAQIYFRSKYCTEDKLKGQVSLESAAIAFFGFQNAPSSNGEEEESAVPADTELTKFKDALERHLKDGSFVYIAVCPEIDEVAEYMIEYLSLCTRMRIYGVELEYFKHQNTDIVIPRAIAYRPPKPAGSSSGSPRRLITEEDFEQRIQSWGEEYWRIYADFKKELVDLNGWFKPYSTGMGIYVRLGKGDSADASLGYIDVADKEGPLHILSGERLRRYVEERDDLDYFTETVRQAYERRIKDFPESFQTSLMSDTWFSTHVGKIDATTFRRFLDMLLEFYKTEILPQVK